MLNKKIIDQIGKYKVYTVNGSYIRSINKKLHEFPNFSIHQGFPDLIPNNEVYIDEAIRPEEYPFFIYNALERYKRLDAGASYEKAYEFSLRKEKLLRNIKEGKHNLKYNRPVPAEIYLELLDQISNYSVFLVNGRLVRDTFKTDFIEGGNFSVYKWIPKNQIWISNDVKKEEIPLVILHEVIESKLMEEKHLSYDKAHRIAAQLEFSEEGKINSQNVDKIVKQIEKKHEVN